MIPVADLRTLSAARLEDARALLTAGRPDGAAYLCGYGVELALKARICQTLGWPGFFGSGSEFNDYKTFKTHDLMVLLHLSGVESSVLAACGTEWSIVSRWDPENRYLPIGTTTPNKAATMIEAATTVLKNL